MGILIALTQFFLVTPSFAEGLTPSSSQLSLRFPGAKDYEAVGVGEDCSIYRSTREKAVRQIQYAKAMEARYVEGMAQGQMALESCARQHGIGGGAEGAMRQDVLMAELCASQYRNWLKPAARLNLLKADIREATEMRDLMTARLRSYCGHISDEENANW